MTVKRWCHLRAALVIGVVVIPSYEPLSQSPRPLSEYVSSSRVAVAIATLATLPRVSRIVPGVGSGRQQQQT